MNIKQELDLQKLTLCAAAGKVGRRGVIIQTSDKLRILFLTIFAICTSFLIVCTRFTITKTLCGIFTKKALLVIHYYCSCMEGTETRYVYLKGKEKINALNN